MTTDSPSKKPKQDKQAKPAKTKTKAVGQPDKLTCLEETQDAIVRQRSIVDGLTAELKSAKAMLATLESRRDAIHSLGPDALKAQQPLFSGPDEKAKAAKNGKPAKADAKPKGNIATAWRSRPVKDAITIGAVVNQLETWDPAVRNLGELHLWLKNHKFQDLPGVGADKAGDAIDQYEAFFKANAHYVR